MPRLRRVAARVSAMSPVRGESADPRDATTPVPGRAGIRRSGPVLPSWRGVRALGSGSRLAGDSADRSSACRPLARRAGRRPSDLCETADAYIVTAELPGLSRDQVRHRVPRRPPDPAGTPRRPRRLRAVSPGGTRSRRVSRGRSACRWTSTPTRITADLTDGVLTVIVPKAAGSGPSPGRRRVAPHAPLRARPARSCWPDWSPASSVGPAAEPRPIAARHRRRRCRTGRPGAGHAAPPPRCGGRARLHARRRAGRRAPSRTSRRCRWSRVRTSPFANDPFFQYFFGDQDDMFGSRNRYESSLGSGVVVSPTATWSPTTTCRRGDVAVTVTASATSASWRAKMIGVDSWTDLALLKVDATGLPDHAVGRLVEAEGRRVGDGHRQPVLAQSDGDAGHRERARPRQRRASPPTRTSSRPTPPSTRATRAARWSTAAASWSASTPRSSRRAAATRASASPCRATSRGASSTT